MTAIVLFAGVLLLIYAGAAIAGVDMAASSRMRTHSPRYAAVAGGLGAVLLVVGLVLILW